MGSVAFMPKCGISTSLSSRFAELSSESLRPDKGSVAVLSANLLARGMDSYIGVTPIGSTWALVKDTVARQDGTVTPALSECHSVICSDNITTGEPGVVREQEYSLVPQPDAQPMCRRSKKKATVAGGKVVTRRNAKATSAVNTGDTVVVAVGPKVVKRRAKQGESLLSAMWGEGVIEPLMVVDSVKDDNYVISIPGERREHLIPGSCVRSHALAVNEVVRSYAQLLNVPTTSIQLYEADLTAQFAAIRQEFSDASFREEVLADAKGFSFPEEVLSRDRLAYDTTGGSLRTLVEHMQSEKSYDRFNQARCDMVFRDDPEYDRLSSLATDGVIINVQ